MDKNVSFQFGWIRHLCPRNRIFFYALFFFYLVPAYGQTYWALKQSGANVDATRAVVSDLAGNTYTTGYFSTQAQINGTTQNVNGLTDIFLTKINPNGDNVWVKSAGGSSSDRGLSIAVDNVGNVIVCGFFSGTINFGNGISISSNSGSQDAFVVKYDPSGTALWARAGGSSGPSDRANGVSVDNAGNIIITGEYSGNALFEALSLSSLNNSIDAFIVKYDASGTALWARSGSGVDTDRGLSIAIDNSNALYVVGQFDGDITFDNFYPNTIQNAIFLVKYSASGSEEWFRWAGGSEQSIANDIASDGSNVYLTGDFGSSLAFLGSGTTTLNSGYSDAVFIAAYSGSGNLLWQKSQGSSSAVSAAGISYANGELGVAGWYGCTFESLSDQYGESAFNSIGYKDAYAMRYSSSGAFIYARNFGSQKDEVCTDIEILPDGREVITGTFIDRMYIPVALPMPSGLIAVDNTPNADLTYCNDPNYGVFGALNSAGNDIDGFTIKAINPNRAPFDYYQRFGSGCDLSIPDLCISNTLYPTSFACTDTIVGCDTYAVFAHNFIPNNSTVGYQPNYSWNPPSSGNSFTATTPQDVTVTVSSADGCYTQTDGVYVDFYESANQALLSDGLGVNTLSSSPQNIYLCPGESVEIWADFPDNYSFSWGGSGLGPGQSELDTITASESGTYAITVENEFGCTALTTVLVVVYELPPENVDPAILIPNLVNDSLTVCGSQSFQAFAFDLNTDTQVPSQFFDWIWTISPAGNIYSGGSSTTASVTQSGWYTITVEFSVEEHPCTDDTQTYTATDSVYVMVYPVPQPSVSLTGPDFACAGDTMILHLNWEGDAIQLPPSVVANYGDSLAVISPGQFVVDVTSINEFGCEASASASWTINAATTPSIVSNPSLPIICPGDSVLLSSESTGGSILWVGAEGQISTDNEIYVHQAGAYYTEVTYYEGCALVSNTINVVEYATPYISGNDGIMCPGVPLEISIVSPIITDITWMEPLTGSDTTQIITEPGIYTAQITSCGIVSEVTIEINADTNTVAIYQPDLSPVCMGDSIYIQALPDTYESYFWSPQGIAAGVYFIEPGTIQATAVDSFGCELTSNVLSIDFELIPPAPVFDYVPVCEGETQLVMVNSLFTTTYLSELDGFIIQEDPLFTIPNFVNDTTLYAFLSSLYCSSPVDSLALSPKPFPEDPILASDEPVCTGTSLNLSVLNPTNGADYYWSSPSGNVFSGDDVSYFVSDMGEAGVYSCYADLNACLSDTFFLAVDLYDTQQLVLPPDTQMCYRGGHLIVPNMQFQDYLWQDGSTDSTFTTHETTSLFLVVHDFNGCQSFDDMYVELVDCNPIVPNIFSPNADGMNDHWFVSLDQPRNVKITVFNRWGLKVYESNKVSDFWDGVNYKTDKECSEGIYFYLVRIVDFEGTSMEAHGPLTLIRN